MLVDPARFRTEINWFSCHNSGVSACDVLPSAGLSTESIRSPTYLFLRRLSFFPVSFMVMIIIFLSPSPACRGAIYQRCTSEDNGDNRSSACSSSALWQCFTTNPIAAKPRSLSLSLSLKSFQRRQLSTLQLIAVLRLLPSGRISLSTNNGNVSAPAVTAYRPSKITQRVSFTKRLIGQPVEPKRNSSTRKLVDFSPKFVRSNKEEALSTYTQRSASEGHLVSSWLS